MMTWQNGTKLRWFCHFFEVFLLCKHSEAKIQIDSGNAFENQTFWLFSFRSSERRRMLKIVRKSNKNSENTTNLNIRKSFNKIHRIETLTSEVSQKD